MDPVRRFLEAVPTRTDAIPREQHQALDGELDGLRRLLATAANGPARDLAGAILARSTDAADHCTDWPLLSWSWWSPGWLTWRLFARIEPREHRYPLYRVFKSMMVYMRDARGAEERRQLGEKLLRRVRVYLDLRGLLEEDALQQGLTPHSLTWGSAVVEDLPILQYRLLEVLWGSGGPLFQPVAIEELVRRVYRTRREQPSNPRRALLEVWHRTSERLEQIGVRLEIERVGDRLQLKPLRAEHAHVSAACRAGRQN